MSPRIPVHQSKETNKSVERDQYISRKRSIYQSQGTYISQRGPTYQSKEIHISVKRDIYIRGKRPIYQSKEICL